MGYMLAKNRYNLKFGMQDIQAWFYNTMYGLLKPLQILEFGRSYIFFIFTLTLGHLHRYKSKVSEIFFQNFV